MGATSSTIHRVHLSIPENATEYTIIKNMEDELTGKNISITKTFSDSILKNASIIVFLSNETPRSYNQAKEIDYAKNEQNKIFYILLDVKYNQNKWVTDFIGEDGWMEYDNSIDINTIMDHFYETKPV